MNSLFTELLFAKEQAQYHREQLARNTLSGFEDNPVITLHSNMIRLYLDMIVELEAYAVARGYVAKVTLPLIDQLKKAQELASDYNGTAFDLLLDNEDELADKYIAKYKEQQHKIRVIEVKMKMVYEVDTVY